jgi:tetratricopeptide (TPR) repeat protein
MNEAVNIAQEVGDVALEFSILPILGHHTVSQSLNEGLDILYRALKIYLDHFSDKNAREKPPEMNRVFHRLQGYIGVAEFDRGNFGVAHGYLRKSKEGFERLGFSEERIPPLSFLSQLLISLGCFEEAETSLGEALDILKEDDGSNAWRGYILGLLGKLYLEWGRFADASSALKKGWQET